MAELPENGEGSVFLRELEVVGVIVASLTFEEGLGFGNGEPKFFLVRFSRGLDVVQIFLSGFRVCQGI